MSEREIGLREARAQLGDLVAKAQYNRKTTIITRNGRPAAMITPVPQHLALRDITVDFIDRDDQREQAITNWLEAAAAAGYGFTVIATYDEGDVLAVVARDDWSDEDEMKLGERMTLRIDRTGSTVDAGEGDLLGIVPGPHDGEIATASTADSSHNLGEGADVLVPQMGGLVAGDSGTATSNDADEEVQPRR